MICLSSVANSSVKKVAVLREAIVRLTACECYRTAASAARGQYCKTICAFTSESLKSLQQHRKKLLDLSVVAFDNKSCQEGLESRQIVAKLATQLSSSFQYVTRH